MNTPAHPSSLEAEDAASYPLDELDISLPRRFQDNSFWSFFERMRREDPVHYCKDSLFGPYWSITKFDDIMAIDKDHETFSSDEGITLADRQLDFNTTNFIAMDPPKHDVQRRTVQGSVAPKNLAQMEGTIRSRVIDILESHPRVRRSTG